MKSQCVVEECPILLGGELEEPIRLQDRGLGALVAATFTTHDAQSQSLFRVYRSTQSSEFRDASLEMWDIDLFDCFELPGLLSNLS